jgi:hypothetical protein
MARPGWDSSDLNADRPDRARGGAGQPSHVAPLFTFTAPLLVSIAVAYAATFLAALTCAGHGSHQICGAYGPPIGHAFFAEAAHIVAILLVALAIEARLLVDSSRPEERALVGVTMLGLAAGIAASLTAAAADSGNASAAVPAHHPSAGNRRYDKLSCCRSSGSLPRLAVDAQ